MQVPLIDLKAQYETIRGEIQTAIQAVLESQKFILDAEVHALENEMADFTSSKHAIACASGTDAILLSLLVLGVKEGDEVITTSYSFFSTAGMIAWLRATPVFVDIDPRTFNLDPESVLRKITVRTRAIIAVHLFGQCSKVESMTNAGVPIIEDAAQAIGSMRHGRPAGSLGATGCFSFFPTKNMGGYGDGGMITTQDQQLADRLRQMRAHGQGSERYLHHTIGTNSRLDELQAAVLRVKLKHLPEWNRQRKANAEYYMAELTGLPVELPEIDEGNSSNYHQFVIKTDARDRLKTHLAERAVSTAIYYPLPLPLQPCFQDSGRKGYFPQAEKCAASSLALPVYPELTGAQKEYVVSSIRSFFQE